MKLALCQILSARKYIILYHIILYGVKYLYTPDYIS